ncbi:Eukaryotic translation initiation factor 2-alpha kinase 4 [Papilio machaon]|uniref:Eukaryotic translation initiation factor 2-alpha kinase 4 n=1 Tax=Papilio machaon TaxID=76193 RepID=A0A194RH73_PAPMA|nr:Eukaryotic translation initiation factor 2-alpha kinase 4 [Papilio machaon]
MGDDTPEERQNNELVVLKSIYGESVVEVGDEEESWNGEEQVSADWRPLHVALALLPLHDSAGAHCSLTLTFKCCRRYPDKPPKISVRSVRGLSLENMNKLLQELDQMAAEMCGEVMIYQLASHTQQFLHEHNKPMLSFYEQMVKEKTQLEEMRQRDLQIKEHEEARQMRAALLRRQETLDADVADSSERDAEDAGGEEGARTDFRLLCYEERAGAEWGGAGEAECAGGECACAPRTLRPVRFAAANTKMYLGHCLGHSRLGSAHLALEESGAPALVRRWQLPAAADVRRRERQLAALQREAAAVRALRCPALEPYRAVQVQSGARTQLYAARRLLAGGSLRRFAAASRLYLGAADSLRLVRRVGRALLAALAALHEAGVLHGDVRARNLYLDPDGEVRLVGAAVDARLLELMRGDDSCDRCAAHDERSLWPAARLAAHPFLQPGPPRTPPPSHVQDPAAETETEVEERGAKEEREEESEAGGELRALGVLASGASRLSLDFEVLSWIGKGGFGDVVKVRNKLDCGVYAIKRIQLNPRDVALNRKIMREVKLLSRLSHEHVVRYYNAWVESSVSPRAGRPPPPPRLEWSLSGAPPAAAARPTPTPTPTPTLTPTKIPTSKTTAPAPGL